ncbi:hypothetical protein OF001_U80083 [Pseudomonas sp. OF001]|nr:hypothetical protein OF001_U80083 [Pseudomonas sp. OF001]
MAVHPPVREGRDLPQERHRQLGPGGPDRAGQRAGDRRPRLALGRADREARDPHVLLPHHRLCGGAARRPRQARRLARAGQDHAAQLDRQELRRRHRVRLRRRDLRWRGPPEGLLDPPGHPDGRHLRGRRRRARAGPARRRGQRRAGRLHRRMQVRLGGRGRRGDHGEEGHGHRPVRRPSADRRQAAGVRRQLRAGRLRRRRGDGGAGPRRARLRVRQQVRSADRAGLPPGRGRRHLRRCPVAGLVHRQGEPGHRQQRQVRQPGVPGRLRRHRRRPGSRQPRREADPLPPARLGHQPPALLGLPDPDHPLRRLRRRAGAGRPAAGGAARERGAGRRRQPAGTDARVLQLQLPEMRRAGQARNRHHGHLRRVVLVLRPLRLAAVRRRHGRQGRGQPLAAGRPVHRRHRARHPAPALRALLPQADARRGPGRQRRAVHQPADPGHGDRRDLLPPAGERQQAVVQPGRRRGRHRRQRQGHRRAPEERRPAGGNRRHREDVEVEEQRRRPADHDRTVRRRHLPPVHDVRRSAGNEPGVVRLRRRGRLALPAPRLAPGPGPRRRRPAGRAGQRQPERCSEGRPPRHPPGHQTGKYRYRPVPQVQHRHRPGDDPDERAGEGTDLERAGPRPAAGRPGGRDPAAGADHPAHQPCPVAGARPRRRGDRRRLAGGRRVRPGAGHPDPGGAGQRQAARRDPGRRRGQPRGGRGRRARQRERAALHRRRDHPQGDRGPRQAGQHRRQLTDTVQPAARPARAAFHTRDA